MGEFQDKVVLVTGAGRGAGRAAAEGFAAQGALVAANDLTPINLDETIARIRRAGGRAMDYVSDVTKRMPIEAMITQVMADWGRIDILVNSASVKPRASILDMDEWDWNRTLEVNLSGPFLTMQLVGRIMRQQGAGAIVNIGSDAGLRGGLAGRAAYLASKTGLIGLTHEAAREFAAYGIRVNLVCLSENDDSAESPVSNGQPSPADAIGEIVLYLCSQEAGGLTGQSINLDRKNIVE